MEYSPPPFFKQGPSALVRLFFFSVLALTLLVADARFNALGSIRKLLGTAIYPVQRAVLYPGQVFSGWGSYFTSIATLKTDNERLVREKTSLAEGALKNGYLDAENAQLRKLLGTREKAAEKSVAAQILYDAHNAAARKIIVDRGTSDGIEPGQPVIDDAGVIGQVTRVFPFTSEVTLLTDKDQAIPVQNLRTGVRAVAYGGAQGGMLDLRFLAANADVQKGDVLVTSGLDGVFPAGLPVARVERVERNAAYAFAQILCVPIGGTDRQRDVLVILGERVAPPPEPETPADLRHKNRMKN